MHGVVESHSGETNFLLRIHTNELLPVFVAAAPTYTTPLFDPLSITDCRLMDRRPQSTPVASRILSILFA